MSGGRFNYLDSQLKSEIFGWADKPRNVFEDKEVQSIAAKYQRTVGQILVKFYNQEGCSAIPKSVHEERLRSNLSINDFVIKEEDMILLKKINRNYSCNDLEGFCSMVGIDKDKYFKQDD